MYMYNQHYGPPVYGPPVYGPPVYGPSVYGPSVYGPPVSKQTLQRNMWAAAHSM